MNRLDETLARVPLNEVTIRTTIDSYAVIERIQHAVQPVLFIPRKGQSFTFHGSCRGNYFKLHCHYYNSDGEDAYPNWELFGLALETSPAFYGRVFDLEAGSAVIRGHFGLPLPTFLLSCALSMLLFGMLSKSCEDFAFFLSLGLIFYSVFSMFEFYTERKGILDFLKGLFFDVTKTR